ncbi:MAG: transketolase, partial [Spirochaetota bacterium]
MEKYGKTVDISILEKKARQLRATCVQIAHDGKEGHVKGALSAIDILVALYYYWLNVSPDEPNGKDRDRLVF